MEKFRYKIYGLNIESEIKLPGLLPYESEVPDTFIRIGQVPEHLENVRNKGVLYESSLNDFLFRFDSIGRFRVENGKHITVQPNEDATIEEIQLFLLGSTMGGLLHQRGILPIHGSAISNEKDAYIIAGASSSGKSSLAAALLNKGYTVLSDDISVIEFRNSKPFIHPGTPYLKLWNNVLSYLNDHSELIKVRPKLEKYYKPVRREHLYDPVKVKSVIILKLKNTPGFVKKQLRGTEKFNQLWLNTYRIQYSENLEQSVIQFENLSTLANKIEVYSLERPSNPIQLVELADFFQEGVISL